MKLCECGCGQPTKEAYAQKRYGYKRGDYRRFVKGHYRKNGPKQLDRVERVCQRCGANFTIARRYVEKGGGLYCSTSCRNKTNFIGDKNPAWRGGVVDWGGGGKYRGIYKPNHPRAIDNYVGEHILIAEAALGKYLPDGAVVHHVNGVEDDNRNSNLVICENNGYHLFLHGKARRIQNGKSFTDSSAT